MGKVMGEEIFFRKHKWRAKNSHMIVYLHTKLVQFGIFQKKGLVYIFGV